MQHLPHDSHPSFADLPTTMPQANENLALQANKNLALLLLPLCNGPSALVDHLSDMPHTQCSLKMTMTLMTSAITSTWHHCLPGTPTLNNMKLDLTQPILLPTDLCSRQSIHRTSPFTKLTLVLLGSTHCLQATWVSDLMLRLDST